MHIWFYAEFQWFLACGLVYISTCAECTGLKISLIPTYIMISKKISETQPF